MTTKWDDIQQKLLYDARDKKFLAFCSWSNQKEKERIDPTFQDLCHNLIQLKGEVIYFICRELY
jgi:hypothetical protein